MTEKAKSTLPINGVFSNEEIKTKFVQSKKILKPKFFINPHPGFEVASLPNGQLVKFAYGKIYGSHYPDIDIELTQIKYWEEKFYDWIERSKHHSMGNVAPRNEAVEKLKFHYKQVVAIISANMPYLDIAGGWNRWSEGILTMFLSDKLHKVLWGSGGCGKSVIMAMLLYIKWRVNPENRMVVIATKVVAEAKARVFAYMKQIHAGSPASEGKNIEIYDGSKEQGIYTIIRTDTGKLVKHDRGCIVSLPVKVTAKNEEIGSNLIGRHPTDRLIIAFDEGQELPAHMTEQKVFLNWKTNDHLDIYCWGNPSPIEFHTPSEWDLLYKLGAGTASLAKMREREKNKEKTDMWTTADTYTLRLAMTDSPKDDPEERINFVTKNGQRRLRLFFIGGKSNVDSIKESVNLESAEGYSQVYGFPFISSTGSGDATVLSSFLVKSTLTYPLHWRTPENQLEWFMSVDPSISGERDKAAVVCGRAGGMMDARQGLDILDGKYCTRVSKRDGEEFIDTTIETMYQYSRQLGIPLKNIIVETHGTGEVFRYALNRHIKDLKKWIGDYEEGQRYNIISPVVPCTERSLFKTLGKMHPAKEICYDITTERYLAIRCLYQTRQIFNVPEYILQQFYNRYLKMDGKNLVYKVESKVDMKKRGIKSPDDADALCGLVDLVRNRGLLKLKYLKDYSYTNRFGVEYHDRKRQRAVSEQLGIVTNMLGVRMDLGEYSGNSKKKRRFDFEAI